MQKSVYQLSCEVYDAINMYLNHGRHELLKENYQKVHKEYQDAGGENPIEFFEKTIDQYNIQGICGY